MSRFNHIDLTSHATSRLAALLTVALLVGCAAPSGGTGQGGSTGQSTGTDPNYDKDGKRKAVVIKQTDRGAQITSDERIMFETGKAEVKADGQVFVQRVAGILKDKTKANVVVEGHTDNVGTAELNQALSTQRANAVRDGLIASGVAASRIQATGFGFNKPVADNTTPDGRQSNRRTEIIVIGETVERITGGAPAAGFADQLASGLDKFLQNAAGILSNVFGGQKK